MHYHPKRGRSLLRQIIRGQESPHRLRIRLNTLQHFKAHLDDADGTLKFLTLPGAHWIFEQQLQRLWGAGAVRFSTVESEDSYFRQARGRGIGGKAHTAHFRFGVAKLLTGFTTTRTTMVRAQLAQVLNAGPQGRTLRAAFSDFDGVWLDTCNQIAQPLATSLTELPVRLNQQRKSVPVCITIQAARERGEWRSIIQDPGRSQWLRDTLQAGSDASDLPWDFQVDAEHSYTSSKGGAPMLYAQLTATNRRKASIHPPTSL